ncbi:MAG TPA: DEAD/DEAH box helicase, partial [Erythrobacter sp.]|nr:DEAD/DEAH box helicase [Erythrobacter sp.]
PGVGVVAVYGGAPMGPQLKAIRQGAQIIVATPGRLVDHLSRNGTLLSTIQYLVLDEADEMLDMGFREDLEEILDATPDTRRTLLFSATMPRPIERLAERYQRNALRLSLAGETRGHGDIAYQAITVGPSEIENAVVNLLRFHEAETAICFCATRESVRRLHATLQNRGFGVVALSGEHSQSERNQALQALRDRRARVCVATDVAARGIDLPTLSLVIHVEIPRDAETLQHRSGRTGRAGKKGTAALVVPYNRRRRVEGMLRGAQIEAEWLDAPTREAIRAKDRTRLIERLTEPREFDEYERELGAQLMAKMSPEDIATALVQTLRAEMPAPEELIANTPEARDRAKAERHRPGFEDVVWFRMSIGRRQNAEPRWLLPLICRRGHITRNEIGAIRIGQHESWFQVPRPIAAKVAETVTRTASPEDEQDEIMIEEAPDGPRIEARENRRKHADGGGRVDPRPAGRGPHRKPGGKPPFKKGKPGSVKPGAGKGAGAG